MGNWLLITLVSHLEHCMDPWPFYTFYEILPNCYHLGTLCSRKIFLSQEPLYTLSSGGPAHHVAVVILELCKLLVIPTDNIWSPKLHTFDEVPLY